MKQEGEKIAQNGRGFLVRVPVTKAASGEYEAAVRLRPLGGGAPVLDPAAPDERAPAAHLHPDEGFLFFGERNGATQVIGAAHHP